MSNPLHEAKAFAITEKICPAEENSGLLAKPFEVW
jgi:hypothetical protein